MRDAAGDRNWRPNVIRTVTGDVESIRGRILPHEHLQIDLSAQKGPANKIGAAEEAAVVEDLVQAKEYGLAAITDLSAPLWGRDPAALRRISEKSGVRCGVIKVGTAREPSEPAERLFKAAAAASRATGAPVITHTSSVEQAAWHVRVLEIAGMDMSHVVISHMGAAKDISVLVEVARSGAFMGVDKVSFPKGPTNVELADLVRDACDKGLERQLLLSSDIARRTLLSRFGGGGYCTVFRDFVPMLEERGIPSATIELMLQDNPARMLQLAK